MKVNKGRAVTHGQFRDFMRHVTDERQIEDMLDRLHGTPIEDLIEISHEAGGRGQGNSTQLIEGIHDEMVRQARLNREEKRSLKSVQLAEKWNQEEQAKRGRHKAKRSELNDFIDASRSLTDAQLTQYLEELGVPASSQPTDRQKKIDKIVFILREGGGTPGGGGLSRVNWRKRVEMCSVTNKWYVVKSEGAGEEREGPFDSEAEALKSISRSEYRSRSVRKRLNKGQAVTDDPSGRHVITYVMTTGTEDRDGETVDPLGGDFSEYALNPTVQFNHDTDNLGVGSMAMELAGPVPDGMDPVHPKLAIWNDYVGEGTNWPQVGGPRRMALLGNIYYDLLTQQSIDCYNKARAGTFRGCSISFLPLGPVQRGKGSGNHYPRWKLLEETVCSVPSNPDAVAVKIVKSLKSWNGEYAGPFATRMEAEAIAYQVNKQLEMASW